METKKITKYSFATMIVASFLTAASIGNYYNQTYDLKSQLEASGYLKPYVKMETNKEDMNDNENA